MKSSFAGAALPLLYIDDNLNDRLLVQEAIQRANTPFAFYAADDPPSAREYFQPYPQPEHPYPVLILLDYEMGSHTGTDFLNWLRNRMKMTSIPVIMYSGSVGARHVAECYAAGATHFLSKPRTLSRIVEMVQTLYDCVSVTPPEFGLLRRLPEYVPDPRTSAIQPFTV